MRVLFDINIILDVLLDRHPFAEDAISLMQMVESGDLQGCLCATTITTLDYLMCKVIGKEKARTEIKKLLILFEIAAMNRTVLEKALVNPIKDFEDAVIYEAAFHHGVHAIVTRNIKDFHKVALPVYTAKQLLALAETIDAKKVHFKAIITMKSKLRR